MTQRRTPALFMQRTTNTSRKLIGATICGFTAGCLTSTIFHQWNKNANGGVQRGSDQQSNDRHQNSRILQVDKRSAVGWPVDNLLHTLKEYDGHVVQVDRRLKVPRWVGETLSKRSLGKAREGKRNGGISRSRAHFCEDKSVPPAFRATLQDYKGSGLDRGHMAAAGNHGATQEELNDTFRLSNICPQEPNLNRRYWERLERWSRQLVSDNEEEDVTIITGPLFLPQAQEVDIEQETQTIPPDEPNPNEGAFTAVTKDRVVTFRLLNGNVAVPTHFFKAICTRTKHVNEKGANVDVNKDPYSYRSAAFIIPNIPVHDGVPLTKFLVPLEVLERASGLVFFRKVPRQQLEPLLEKGSKVLPPPIDWKARNKLDKSSRL